MIFGMTNCVQVEARTAEFIAAGSLGGCADKAAIERSVHNQSHHNMIPRDGSDRLRGVVAGRSMVPGKSNRSR